MKKLVFGRKLSRDYSSRQALFRSLIQALIEHGSIKTTRAKAKAVQGEVDKLVHLAQDKSIAARRRAYAVLGNNRDLSEKLFTVANGFGDVKSGFTRIVHLGPRKGDLADMARLEWARQVAALSNVDDNKNRTQKGSSAETLVKSSLATKLPKIGKAKAEKKTKRSSKKEPKKETKPAKKGAAKKK
jgi:large subunit ribosomal protein L17